MKCTSIINSLILIGIMLGNNCFASEAPKSYWERLKAFVGWKKAEQEVRQEKPTTSRITTTALISEEEKAALEKIKVRFGESNVMKVIEDLAGMAIVGGLMGSTVASVAVIPGLALITPNISLLPIMLAFAGSGSIVGIATEVMPKLEFYLKNRSITEEQMLDAQKNTYIRLLHDSDAFPTGQMQLNEVIRLIVQFSKEKSSLAQYQVKVLNLVKKELEDNPVMKKIKGFQLDLRDLYKTGESDLLQTLQDKQKSSSDVVDKLAYTDMIINEYIRQLSSIYPKDKLSEETTLWNQLEKELKLLNRLEMKNPDREFEDAQIILELQKLRSEGNPYKYAAFKSVLKALNPTDSLQDIFNKNKTRREGA